MSEVMLCKVMRKKESKNEAAIFCRVLRSRTATDGTVRMRDAVGERGREREKERDGKI